MAFKKNKRQNIVVSAFALLALSSGIFLLTPSSTHAASFLDILTTNPFKWLLYGLFWVCGLIASMAITLFEWAVNPDYTSGPGGLLNRASVYTMWQFIRDFFNLFFIMTLLYTAFTIVFQVASNYKKTLLSIVLAALFVNFSFPITRVIIDVANVPMYYFINQIGSTNENKEILGTVLSASKIQGILIPGSESGIGDVNIKDMGVAQLLMAIIFLFIFSVTLLVLAVLFVIRLVALVVLLIFSSVGFAASVIPGLGKYSGMWWEKLWQYTFFGPAAMLMLFVATRFFAEIAQDNTKAQFVESAIANVASSEAGFVSSMAMFTIPIIMLWMAIGLATSMSIMGAGAVAGQGQKFIKGAARKFSGYNAAKRNIDSYSATRKKRQDEINKSNMGGSFGKWANKTQDDTHGKLGKMPYVGRFVPGSKAASTRFEDMKTKEKYEKAEENKKNGVSDTELRTQLKSTDDVVAAAAAMTLSERKAITSADEFDTALKALGDNTKEVATLISNASSGALNLTTEQYGKATSSGVFAKDARLKGMLDDKLREKGKAKVLVESELSKLPGGASSAQTEDIQHAVAKVMKEMKSAKHIAASESLFEDEKYGKYAAQYITDQGADRVQAIKKVSAEEGTSVGGRLSGATVTGNNDAAQKAERERLHEKMQARKKENGR